MHEHLDPVEMFWDHILSREPEKICRAFAAIAASQQRSVLAHLQKMVTEEGWHPEQQKSAQAALKALKEIYHKD